MVLVKDSLAIVLVGDWNKLYIQPEWISANVYMKNEIEIGINGQGTDLQVIYKCDGVVIAHTQNQVIFTAMNMDEKTIIALISCVNNYLKNAYTPILVAYGFNCDFIDNESSLFAEVVDSISDSLAIIGNGYEIKATTINRTIEKNGKILNIESSRTDNMTKIHFNEHNGNATDKMPEIEMDQIQAFLTGCNSLIEAFGYDLENDE